MKGESETFIRTGSSRAAAVEEQLQISARVQVHARSAHALTRTNLQSDRFLQKRVSWRQRGQKLPRSSLAEATAAAVDSCKTLRVQVSRKCSKDLGRRCLQKNTAPLRGQK